MKKLILIFLGIVLFLAIVAFAAQSIITQKNELSKFCPNLDNCSQNFDAVIAISGGDTTARTLFATDIFKNGIGKKLIFSGANSDSRVLSDAEQMSLIAQRNGVSGSKIITEKRARNTEENAKFTAEIIKKNKFSRVVLVTSPYHTTRAKLEFERALQHSGIQVVVAPASNDKDLGDFWWLSARGWYLVTSEVGGIIRFYLGAKING